MKIVIITGFSGSGKSTALRYVEEHGYYCVDNLPAQLLTHFISIAKENDIEKVAVVMDARGREFMKDLNAQLDDLGKKNKIRIVFFDSDLASITKRFNEHRMRHPLALRGTIAEGFQLESKLLTSLRQRANLILNTSGLNVHSLKNLINKYILGEKNENFSIHLMSFGFKYGIPQEVDIVIDVRMLINPFFEPSLKRFNGKNPKISRFMLRDKDTPDFIKKTQSYLEYLIKKYESKSKPFVTIGFGCTGGRHRSVFIAEKMKSILQRKHKKVKVLHRDMQLD
jgi:UPF0042 nucleotide-binding protein